MRLKHSPVVFAAGALLPFFWMFTGLLLMGIPEGPVSKAYWLVVYVTCPVFLLTSSDVWLAIGSGCTIASVFTIFQTARVISVKQRMQN